MISTVKPTTDRQAEAAELKAKLEKVPAKQLLREAETLFRKGFHRAAAVAARSAIESGLYRECIKRQCLGVALERGGGMPAFLNRLFWSGHISKTEKNRLKKSLQPGHSAAHGGRITRAGAASILWTANEVVRRGNLDIPRETIHASVARNKLTVPELIRAFWRMHVLRLA